MSHFAQRFTGLSGIASLMEDLGDALNNNPDMIFMGGGNPANIPEVEACIAKHLQKIAQEPEELRKLVGEYQPPQGDPAFLSIIADHLSKEYGWDISPENIAISNGGQSAFFSLFNILADKNAKGETKKIVLPMVPDYLGYADAGMHTDMFDSYHPKIQMLDECTFKYCIDFDSLAIDSNTTAVCLSRPANPSGNVVTDEEIQKLKELCRENDIPLIIDAAYGKPFPGITFVDHQLQWDDSMILILSLSKLGLPGARTGIVIAKPETIQHFSRATASLSLAPGNLGPSICKSLITSGDLFELCDTTIKPYYQEKMQKTVDYIKQKIGDLPIKIHNPEGAFFLWLWLEGLPITNQELYENLKAKGVLIISGHHFFQTADNSSWNHHNECIRLSYCQPWEKVKAGIDCLINEVEQVYKSC